MASVLETAELVDSGGQTAFNLAVWEKVLADPLLGRLPHRIETDRFGQIIMSPPPALEHGEEQFRIGKRLDGLLPAGHVITECPVSTSEGVKLVDVAWMSKDRRQAERGQVCVTQAPEICVEILSPGNTRRELSEKKSLYFAAGAEEVWFCHRDGRMEFFRRDAPEAPASSRLCSGFPERVAWQNDGLAEVTPTILHP
jgi:Uma2 family endonuclease